MLTGLVTFSVRHRAIVIALACLSLGYGAFVASRSKLDVFPEFLPPQVTIQTEAPGLSAEQVEVLVTQPIENAVNGVGHLEAIRSQSIQGLSVITVVFQSGSDVFLARQLLSELLAQTTERLPVGVKSPRMTPLTSATMDLIKIGLVTDKMSPMELRTLADWTIRPRLLAAPGVAKVNVFGGDVRQLQIQVQPERLIAFHLSLTEVLSAARTASAVRGAGFIETAGQRVVIQSEGQSITAEQLGQVVVRSSDSGSVRLRDVAHVVDAPEPKFGDCLVQGRNGVLLTLLSQFGANTLEATTAVEGALDELKPILDANEIKVYPRMFRAANFIENAMHNMKSSLLLGGVLVGVVLFLFLYNLRTGFISLTAIPLSLLTAVAVLNWFGVTINTITLGGLAIAIGEVVDDAIIDVENIFRRLRENWSAGSPIHSLRVVLDASLEVRSAVVYATFVVALVFLPVLTMSGIGGRLFAPLAIAYILAVMASLLVALTVTPALSAVLLAKKPTTWHEPAILVRIKDHYARLLQRWSTRPGRLIVGAVILCIAAASMIPFFGGEFLPEFREGHFVVHMAVAPGTGLAEMRRLGSRVTEELLKIPHIATVEQQIGRAELGEDPWGPHLCEYHVELERISGEEEEEVQSQIRETLSKFPGAFFGIKAFLTERIEESISGETAEFVVALYGDDLDTLDDKARDVARVLSEVSGAVDVQVPGMPVLPQMIVHLRPDRLIQFGMKPADALDTIQTAFQGTTAGQVYEGNRVFDIAVILDAASRQDPESIGSLMIHNDQGVRIPLRELADIYPKNGRYTVSHEGARRRQAITCNIEGRDLNDVVAEAKAKIADHVKLPTGYYAVFSGAEEERRTARTELLMHSTLAGVGIVLLLGMVFGNFRNLMLVLVNLPFAMVGGILAVFMTGGSLSVGSLVGFVTLFGITTRNSIMMISHFDHLVRSEGRIWCLETAIRGATERIVPVLMTAIVTALGLLPIALGSGEAGREIEGPMAIVILGGLATSTLLNLLVLPTLALRFGAFHLVSDNALDSCSPLAATQ
ncbi:MAG: efflux RND transporter permease subunit [Planctomycetes bacterium]|nr:efflux RND transporter permease subunit [Planctomycetota bacterium]